MKKSKILSFKIYIILILMLLVISCLIPACENKKPIKIGFVGGLTDKHYDLGVSGRNGAMLAVESINTRGGIKGHRIELIIKNDLQDPRVAIKVDKELIEQGVAAIVGHMTSGMSLAALPLINEKKVVMISPTAGSAPLGGKDDYFIKLFSNIAVMSEPLADYAFKNKGLRKVSVIYDLYNKAFTEEWLTTFKSRFEGSGGKVIAAVGFDSSEKISYAELSKKLIKSHPDGILIIANAFDTAMISQQIRKINTKIPILSSPWAMSKGVLFHGGKTVEGVIFSHIYHPDTGSPEHKAFKQEYFERFGHEPDFAAMKAYDAVNVIASAISDTKNSQDLKSAILIKQKYRGVTGDFEIDKYGDVKEKPFIVTIRENRFVALE